MKFGILKNFRKSVEKIQVLLKSNPDNAEKYGRARQATDDNIIRRRKVGICIVDKQGKNTDTHS
jgi:hypothetical protein